MKTSLAIKAFEDFASVGELDDSLKVIAAWGYDAVEPMIGSPGRIDCAETVAVLERYGLRVSGFRTGQIYQKEGVSLSDQEKGIRGRAVARLIECAEFAVNFPGSSLLNGLIQGPLQSKVTLEQADERIVECLRVVCGACEKLDVPFSLEAVNRYELPYHNTLKQVAEIIDRIDSPRINMLIDTFHMNIEEVDAAESIRAYGRYIGAVHMADSNRLAPGLGHIDFSKVIQALQDVSYNGFLTVEIMHPHIRDAGESGAANFIKKIL